MAKNKQKSVRLLFKNASNQLFMKKQLYGIKGQELNWFEISQTNTRKHEIYLFVPDNEFHKSIFYRGAEAWINLPDNLKEYPDILTFKRQLKCHRSSFKTIS